MFQHFVFLAALSAGFSASAFAIGNAKFDGTKYGTGLSIGSKIINLDNDEDVELTGSFVQLEALANFGNLFDFGGGLNWFQFKPDAYGPDFHGKAITLDAVMKLHTPAVHLGPTAIDLFAEGRLVLASKISAEEETTEEGESLTLTGTRIPVGYTKIGEISGEEVGGGLRLLSKGYGVQLKYSQGREIRHSEFARFNNKDYDLDFPSNRYTQRTLSLGFQIWR